MFRILIYSFAYIISLGFFLITNQAKFSEGFIFLFFLVSTITYTFSREGLPNKDIATYPEALQYKAKRMNIYGYGMIILLIISSIIIYLNSSFETLNQSILILILWPLIILGSYILARVHNNRESIYPIYEYVCNTLDIQLDFELFQWILSNAKVENDLNRVPKRLLRHDAKILRETLLVINKFIEAENNPINSEEVEAANSSNERSN